MNSITKFLIEIVKEAGQLINENIQIKSKDDNGDIVTNFDYEIEKYIINKIKSKYPEFTIISEEYNSNNNLTNNCFTIDPIDGTINFANNIPLWGIQIACIKDNKTCSAVIYLPMLNEMYYADETGAYLNDKKIKVNLLDITKGIYIVEGPGRIAGQIKMKSISHHCRDFYCAAVSFAWVACGRLSGVIFKKDSFWDYISGQYLVKQAGGVISNDKNSHIAANTDNFLNVLKENASE